MRKFKVKIIPSLSAPDEFYFDTFQRDPTADPKVGRRWHRTFHNTAELTAIRNAINEHLDRQDGGKKER